MYDLIQNLLTSTINIVAIAGLGGIVVHALYNWHLSQLPTAPKANPDYQRSELVDQILESQQPEAEQPCEPTKSGELALIDPWQAPIVSSSSRYWMQTAPQIQPSIFLLPPAKEATKSKTRKTTKSKATPKQTTRKRKAA